MSKKPLVMEITVDARGYTHEYVFEDGLWVEIAVYKCKGSTNIRGDNE